MTALVWDQTGERLYETGVRKGVIYPQGENGNYPTGYAWNGLTSASINPTGAEPNALWADDIKYLNLLSAEEVEGTIEAYMYPDAFKECNGEAELTAGVTIGQQARKPFGFCFRTVLGNDTKLEDYGYKLHIVYGATVQPSEASYETINDSPDAITFSWDYSTTPVNVTGHKPTATLEIDSTKFNTEALKAKLAALEAVLYGSDTTVVYVETADSTKAADKTYYTRASDGNGGYTYTTFTGSEFVSETPYYEAVTAGPRLPLPDEIKTILEGNN